MIETVLLTSLPAAAGGAALGGAYLWHLRRVVDHIRDVPRPGLRLAGQLPARMLAVGAVFLVLARLGGAPALAGALAGFILIRTLVVSRTRRAIAREGAP